MRNARIVRLAAFFALFAALASGQQPPPSLQRILADEQCGATTIHSSWSDCGPCATAANVRPTSSRIERRARRPPELRPDVQARATRLTTLMARPSALQPPFAQLQQRATAPAGATVRAEAVRLRDGDGYHLALTRAAGLQLLRPSLTIDTVRARLGPPEKVTEQAIQNEGEREAGHPHASSIRWRRHRLRRIEHGGAWRRRARRPRPQCRRWRSSTLGDAMQNTVWRRILSTCAFVLIGSGIGLGQARQVNIATDATDTANSGDTEPSIAVNPTNPNEVVVVSFSGNWSATQSAPVWKSSDGGLTWRRVPQIPQPQAGLSGPGDQKVAFDSSGRLHVAELGVNGAQRELRLHLPPDRRGRCRADRRASFGDDQPHLDVDLRTSGTCAGRLYSAVAQLRRRQPRSMVANSVDRGVEHHERRRRQQRDVPEPDEPHRHRAERPRVSHLQDA